MIAFEIVDNRPDPQHVPAGHQMCMFWTGSEDDSPRREWASGIGSFQSRSASTGSTVGTGDRIVAENYRNATFRFGEQPSRIVDFFA